jgi:hypothetical protein
MKNLFPGYRDPGREGVPERRARRFRRKHPRHVPFARRMALGVVGLLDAIMCVTNFIGADDDVVS